MKQPYRKSQSPHLKKIKQSIRNISNELKAIVLELFEMGDIPSYVFNKLNKRLDETFLVERRRIETEVQAVLYKEVVESVEEEVAIAKRLLKKERLGVSGLSATVVKKTDKIRNLITTEIVNAIVAGNVESRRLIKKVYDDRIRDKAMRELTEIAVERGSLRSVLAGLNLKDYPKVLINGRSYNVEKYVYMQLRTQSAVLHSVSTKKTATELGTDLVQVSSHSTRYPICIPYEGKVFSLSGEDTRFPKLDKYPPFHPNCLHSIHITFAEALEERGQLQDAIDFSKGKRTTPPGDTGFIPVKDRDMAVPVRKK